MTIKKCDDGKYPHLNLRVGNFFFLTYPYTGIPQKCHGNSRFTVLFYKPSSLLQLKFAINLMGRDFRKIIATMFFF